MLSDGAGSRVSCCFSSDPISIASFSAIRSASLLRSVEGLIVGEFSVAGEDTSVIGSCFNSLVSANSLSSFRWDSPFRTARCISVLRCRRCPDDDGSSGRRKPVVDAGC